MFVSIKKIPAPEINSARGEVTMETNIIISKNSNLQKSSKRGWFL